MNNSCAFTIVSKNYLPFARALMRSFSKYHPDVRTFVVLADKADGYFDPEAEPFDVIEADALGIEDFESFSFKYNIIEFNTAVKPFSFAHLFSEYGFDKILYLDPDIVVFNPLSKILEALDDHSLVLTPHILAPIPDDGRSPKDIDIIKVGTFNLGFLGLSKGEHTDRLLSWWQERLYDKCLQAPLSGYAVDQVWISLAPCFFDDCHVLRGKGYNVAYWNLHERRIEKEGEEFLVDGSPLYFFHFSGFDPENIQRVSKYQNRFRLSDIPHLEELFRMYSSLLHQEGYRDARAWPYRYGHFKNGSRISELARGIYWGMDTRSENFGNPFEGFWPRLIRLRHLRAVFSGRVMRAMLDKLAVYAWKRLLRKRV